MVASCQFINNWRHIWISVKWAKKFKTEIGSKLPNALEVQIEERRQIEFVTLFQYLQDPQDISIKKGRAFLLASKRDIIKLPEKILSRIYPNSGMGTDCDYDKENIGDRGIN